MSTPTALRAVLAVLAGFIGIRRGQRAAQDSAHLRPVHVVIAGVVMVAAFIALLLFVVQLAVRT